MTEPQPPLVLCFRWLDEIFRGDMALPDEIQAIDCVSTRYHFYGCLFILELIKNIFYRNPLMTPYKPLKKKICLKSVENGAKNGFLYIFSFQSILTNFDSFNVEHMEALRSQHIYKTIETLLRPLKNHQN